MHIPYISWPSLLKSHFFHALRLPYVFFCPPNRPSTSSALLQRLHLSLLPHIHLSSCLKPSYFFRRRADGPWGSCLCRTSMSVLSCLRTHLLSGCPRSGCLCLCIPAHICGRIWLSSVVEEVIHQNLAVLENSHACVHELVQHQLCFAHVDAGHVVSKDCESVKRWTRQQFAYLVSFPVSHYLHVHAVSQVFHRLTKHRVVHQLVEVCSKIAFRLLAKLRVHPDVWLHPRLLTELYHSMHFLQLHSVPEIKLQIAAMNHVLFFVFKSQH